MAKSLRSKRKRKFRSIKREHNEELELERLKNCATLHEERFKLQQKNEQAPSSIQNMEWIPDDTTMKASTHVKQSKMFSHYRQHRKKLCRTKKYQRSKFPRCAR
jgi:hypothetical protein